MRFNSEREHNNIRHALRITDNIFKGTFAKFVSINFFKLERGLTTFVSFKMWKTTRNSSTDEGLGYLLLIKLSSVTVMAR